MDATEQNTRFLRAAVTRMLGERRANFESGVGRRGFMWFTSIVVILIVFCYLYCMYHTIRLWCCRRWYEEDLPVDEGGLFILTAAQRRAVLEAIFSETSKSVKKDVDPKETNTKDDADSAKEDSQNGETTEIDEKDPEAPPVASSDAPLTPVASLHGARREEESKSPDEGDVEEEDEIPNTITPNNHGELIITRRVTLDDDDDDECAKETNASLVMRPSQKCGKCNHLDIPDLGTEKGNDQPPTLQPIKSTPSFANSMTESIAGEDDESQTGDVCAICLNGYDDGDVVVSSKYCSHIFHKDCILEWLGKNDDCPICRKEMVTTGDMNKAAVAVIVKKKKRNPPSPGGRRFRPRLRHSESTSSR